MRQYVTSPEHMTPDNDITADHEKAKYAIWHQCATDWPTVGHLFDCWLAEYMEDAADDPPHTMVSDMCKWLGWERWGLDGYDFNITTHHKCVMSYGLCSNSSKVIIAHHLRHCLGNDYGIILRTEYITDGVLPYKGMHPMRGLPRQGPIHTPIAEAEAIIQCAFCVLACKPNTPS